MSLTLALTDAILEAVLRWAADRLPPRRPLPLIVTLVSEDTGMLTYRLTLPAPGAPDVVRRELSTTINGDTTVADVVDGHEFTVDDNAEVSLFLVDIDDAGNRSEPSPTLTFTATDTLAPPMPGELGVTVIGEA